MSPASNAPLVLPVGLKATVTVPASSANLGPGFDTLGLALGLYDDVTVETVDPETDGDLTVAITGEGADEVPTDDRHLVVVALRRTLTHLGVTAPGLRLTCVNRIPHSRGLGSSAAAAVAGIAAAAALAADADAPRGLTTDEMVQLASEFEGHPDNASASVLGGAVVSWTVPAVPVPDVAGYRDHAAASAAPSAPLHYGARRVDVHPDIRAYAFVPDVQSSTSVTRGMLPRLVPHADAAFNASRAALMVLALTAHPDLLLDATEDRLHQRYRAASMKESSALVERLRAAGVAAAISGAGPTVLALTPQALPTRLADAATEAGFTVRELPVADGVVRS
ncbi:homoserine kinase [Tsukamurella tyrosinosolvens]|uniref:Homoserine kinase n=1 Tax=Tsukamurella tyrosinosolvens TaxID=57704 RepID=A0A1H4Q2Z5_TSUTY|nr:homoserine kinase [Tsukamurella tyrosinosolvens]AUN39789.1 homoserine kinase [Tsukamurella tyrosinosolvens]KXO97519.1 homoserine kinase [Tsukamurella tyrosinosolvens]KXP09023.1 homoserine kinase [Tsukamurella tyrosinosolvens]KZL97251.1 homoserine kinase [Tsukamurella tyrosinosolvens]MCA4996844.1 homoserine kinase [Tsukamurella tyrosinosolvens]